MSQQKNIHRRTFIANAATIGIGLTVLPSLAKSIGIINDVFEPNLLQQPLLYSYNDLEPNIDALTMEIHYTRHAAGYTKNVVDALRAEYQKTEPANLLYLLQNISAYSSKMRNNAGGHYNHELFWQCLTPKSTGKPTGKLADAIVKNFGSLDAFKTQFADAAKARFGSGWAWLIVTPTGDLKITSTTNQDNPLMDIAETKGYPLLALDVWEHAYYLKYQNKRADYINNWWNIVNWSFVEQRFENSK